MITVGVKTLRWVGHLMSYDHIANDNLAGQKCSTRFSTKYIFLHTNFKILDNSSIYKISMLSSMS